MKVLSKNLIKFSLGTLLCSSLFCVPFVNDVDHKGHEVIYSTHNNLSSDVDDSLEIKLIDLKTALGDCSLIRYKDINIMIDIGGEAEKSSQPIYDAIKDLEKIDYMIITHGDKDHLINFYNENCLGKWFSEGGYIDTLIDFDTPEKDDVWKTNGLYSNELAKYKMFRNNNTSGDENTRKIRHYYTASECINEEKGAKPFFKFDSRKNGLRVLDNIFYDQYIESLDDDKKIERNTSIQRNCCSVCVLITVNDHKFLFTGDLMEFDTSKGKILPGETVKSYRRIYGESLLLANNYNYLKDGVDFYKSAHHGSDSSNCSALLDTIRPKYIGLSGAISPHLKSSGSMDTRIKREQAFFNCWKWTDYLYPTCCFSESDDKTVESLYGDVIYTLDLKNNSETFTSSELEKGNTRNVSSMADSYIINNELVPINIFNLNEMEQTGLGIYFNLNKTPRLPIKKGYVACVEYLNKILDSSYNVKNPPQIDGNCTYIKVGHTDILINCGTRLENTIRNYSNVRKIEKLCNDNVLDYLIVTNEVNAEAISGLLTNKGLLESKHIKAIDNFYSFGFNCFNLSQEAKKDVSFIYNHKKIKKAKNKTSSKLNKQLIDILSNKKCNFSINLDFFEMPLNDSCDYRNQDSIDYRDYSLMFTLNVSKGKQKLKYTSIGLTRNIDTITESLSLNANKVKGTDLFELANKGSMYKQSDISEDANQDGAFAFASFVSSMKKINDLRNINFIYNGYFDTTFSKIVNDASQNENDLIRNYFKQMNVMASSIKNDHNIFDYGNIGTRIIFGQQFRTRSYGTFDVAYLNSESMTGIHFRDKEPISL